MEALGKFTAFILMAIIAAILTGFVVLKFWGWFVSPIFEIQQIRLVEAIGLVFLINYLQARYDDNATKGDFWEKFISRSVFLVIYSGLTLLAGYIMSLFM